jgi:hypothetical protein
MSNFKAGEQVVCVHPGHSIGLVKDKIYTVVENAVDVQNEAAVMLLEVAPPEPYHNYLSYRFRKMNDADVEQIEELETVEL